MQKESSSLLKARALEVLVRSVAMGKLGNDQQGNDHQGNDQQGKASVIKQMLAIIDETDDQLEALEIMNIAAGLKDSFAYSFPIVMQNEWNELSHPSSDNFETKKMLNHSTKVRYEYLQSNHRH